jgi:uncharacterized protein
MELSTWLLLGGVIILAHTLETILGFGATLIALALGVHLVPLEQLLIVLVVLGLVQSTWLITRGYRHIDWRTLLTMILPISTVGLIAGMLMRDWAGEAHLKIVLGLFVMAVAGVQLYRLRSGKPPQPPVPWKGAAFLVGGGIFHGLFASGGPLIVYYATRVLPGAAVFRATLAVLWWILNAALFTQLASAGGFGTSAITLTSGLLLAAVIGILIGESIRVRERVFEVMTYGLLFMSGIVLLV